MAAQRIIMSTSMYFSRAFFTQAKCSSRRSMCVNAPRGVGFGGGGHEHHSPSHHRCPLCCAGRDDSPGACRQAAGRHVHPYCAGANGAGHAADDGGASSSADGGAPSSADDGGAPSSADGGAPTTSDGPSERRCGSGTCGAIPVLRPCVATSVVPPVSAHRADGSEVRSRLLHVRGVLLCKRLWVLLHPFLHRSRCKVANPPAPTSPSCVIEGSGRTSMPGSAAWTAQQPRTAPYIPPRSALKMRVISSNRHE